MADAAHEQLQLRTAAVPRSRLACEPGAADAREQLVRVRVRFRVRFSVRVRVRVRVWVRVRVNLLGSGLENGQLEEIR